jgi:hypothetical protein
MAETILEIMKKDHLHFHELMDGIEKESIKGVANLEDSFDNFKFEVENHMLIEEKAIFSYLEEDSEAGRISINRLLEDHELLRELINELELELQNSSEVDLSNLKDAWDAHENFEENSFYDRLDEELDTGKKQEIIERIKEFR